MAVTRLRARLTEPFLTRGLLRTALGRGPEAIEAAERLGQPGLSRPEGPLLWVHAPKGALGFLREFTEVLAQEHPAPVSLLCTVPRDDSVSLPPEVFIQSPPEDQPRVVSRFLQHWRPDAALWLGLGERPILLDEAAHSGIPISLCYDGSSGAARPSRAMLHRFARVFASSDIAAESLRKMDYPTARLSVSGALDGAHSPLGCNEAERSDLAEVIGNRPIWLAVCPPGPEIVTVIEAHRRARRTAHRLLLILVLDDSADHERVAQRLDREGWNVASRASDEEPHPDTEIYLVEGTEELGLWFRLAPQTYLGGTLTGGRCASPLQPASLGSALVVGPQHCDHGDALERLSRADALTRIGEPPDLGEAVVDLLSPDNAARRSLAAWSVATEGADALQQIATALARDLSRRTG